MNLRDLRYLVTVADHRHFSKAAELNCISQPTLSMQLKKLEKFLGVTLIERTNKQVMITPIGHEIVKHARVLLREAEEIRQLAKLAHDPFSGDIKLGIIPTVAPYLLPKILPVLMEKFPELKVYLTEALTQEITNLLGGGYLDAVILTFPLNRDNTTCHKLYQEPFYLAVSKFHPLATKVDISPDDFAEESIILLEDGHCLRDQALEVCQLAGAMENTGFRASSLETLRHMVAANAGVTLVPELAIDKNGTDIIYLPFREPVPYRAIGIAWRQSTTRKELLEKICYVIENVSPCG